MMDAAMVDAARRWLTYACLAGLAAVVLIVFCSAVLPPLCEAWRRVRAKSRAASAMSAAAVVAAILYAGAKPPSVTVTWDEYFASKSYSIDTNDLRRISFAWAAPAWMPETANAILRAYSRTAGVSDVDPAASVPMATGAMTAVMPYDATNYVYFVECDWTPAPAVVTNGVYHVRAVENNERYVPIGVKVVKSITALSYVQDGLIAMWDGIENAGWSVHDQNATMWKNLVEGSAYPDFEIRSGGTWGKNCLQFNGLAAVAKSAWPTFDNLDLVYRIDSGYVDFAPNQKNRMRWFINAAGIGTMFSGGYGSSGLTSKTFLYDNFRYGVANSLAMQYSGNDIGKLYVNGQEKTSTGTRFQSTANPTIASIGSRLAVESSYNTGRGVIWRIAVYNRALTADEIARNYQIDRIRFNLP